MSVSVLLDLIGTKKTDLSNEVRYRSVGIVDGCLTVSFIEGVGGLPYNTILLLCAPAVFCLSLIHLSWLVGCLLIHFGKDDSVGGPHHRCGTPQVSYILDWNTLIGFGFHFLAAPHIIHKLDMHFDIKTTRR